MLERIDEGLYGVAGRAVLPGNVVFPLRAVIARLADGSVWIHSAVPFDEATAAAIDALGPVRWIVAANRMHTLHTRAAAARWPGAQVVAVPGFPAQDGLTVARALDAADLPEPWRADLDAVAIEGAPSVEEVVFLHRPTGTLICTDLLFNVLDPSSLGTRLVLTLVGCNGRLAASRSWRWVFAKDRTALRASAERVLQWPVRRIAPSHGALADVTPEELRTALAQLL